MLYFVTDRNQRARSSYKIINPQKQVCRVIPFSGRTFFQLFHFLCSLESCWWPYRLQRIILFVKTIVPCNLRNIQIIFVPSWRRCWLSEWGVYPEENFRVSCGAIVLHKAKLHWESRAGKLSSCSVRGSLRRHSRLLSSALLKILLLPFLPSWITSTRDSLILKIIRW